MPTHLRLAAVALIAVLAAAYAAATAAANTIAAEPAGSITATSRSRLTFVG